MAYITGKELDKNQDNADGDADGGGAHPFDGWVEIIALHLSRFLLCAGICAAKIRFFIICILALQQVGPKHSKEISKNILNFSFTSFANGVGIYLSLRFPVLILSRAS